MQNNTKSSAVAGILGVFLGAFGGHDWYLNNTKKAIIHVCLCVGGLLLLMVAIILMNISKSIPAINILFMCLMIMSYVIIVGNAVWGIIEGIVIIAQGDAGLKAKGYQVADLATTTMAPAAPVVANDGQASAGAANGQTATGAQTANDASAQAPMAGFSVAKDENAKIEPAHLDNIITAAPANGSVMSSAPVAQATPEVATPNNPTMVATPTNNGGVAPVVESTPATAAAAPVVESAPAANTSNEAAKPATNNANETVKPAAEQVASDATKTVVAEPTVSVSATSTTETPKEINETAIPDPSIAEAAAAGAAAAAEIKAASADANNAPATGSVATGDTAAPATSEPKPPVSPMA